MICLLGICIMSSDCGLWTYNNRLLYFKNETFLANTVQKHLLLRKKSNLHDIVSSLGKKGFLLNKSAFDLEQNFQVAQSYVFFTSKFIETSKAAVCERVTVAAAGNSKSVHSCEQFLNRPSSLNRIPECFTFTCVMAQHLSPKVAVQPRLVY